MLSIKAGTQPAVSGRNRKEPSQMGRHANRHGRKRPYLIYGLLAAAALAVILFTQGRSHPVLQPWHTANLTEEFTAGKLINIKTFDDYRRLEDRLFAQLQEQVYDHTGTGHDHALVRYSKGSAADPQHRNPNWNRSIELPADRPAGGILLLHGMSDSPYSMRALGKAFNSRGYWVIALRLPGHGTAPSGLKNLDWRDMAAAVRLGVEHLAQKVEPGPVHLVGYSTGAPLALNFTLDALEDAATRLPESLILISPAIGIHPIAKLAGLRNTLARIHGLRNLAWLSIQPEFDPYKYNSFATNAGTQVYRITRSVGRRIKALARSGLPQDFPPILVFKSTVDATVSTQAVVDNLLKPLGHRGNELVVFDTNRYAAKTSLLISEPGPFTGRLLADPALPFGLTLVTNESPESRKVVARFKPPQSATVNRSHSLKRVWPVGVVSLSHVALPFPPDDPLYGQRPPEGVGSLFLGQMAIQGERGILKIPYDALMRMRSNPFYEYLESRTLAWVESFGEGRH